MRRCDCVTRCGRQHIVKSGGPLVAAIGFGDDDEAIVLDLHLLVFKAQLAAKLDAARFKPDEIICVIDDAHLVGFRITHADDRFGVIIFMAMKF